VRTFFLVSRMSSGMSHAVGKGCRFPRRRAIPKALLNLSVRKFVAVLSSFNVRVIDSLYPPHFVLFIGRGGCIVCVDYSRHGNSKGHFCTFLRFQRARLHRRCSWLSTFFSLRLFFTLESTTSVYRH
jgi:hypothetical protein